MNPSHQPALEDPTDTWRPLRLPSGLAPADLYAQVRQRFSALDTAEKAIAKERSELGMAWNRTLPVNRLPNELLVSVFAQVADAISASNFGPFEPTMEWTKVILVCRCWRDVAYASPMLWRVIPMQSPGYVQHALALSTPATIDVSFGRFQTNPTNLVGLLQPHAHRLRSLCCRVVEKWWQPTALVLLLDGGGFPALETLEIPFALRETREPRVGDFVDVQLTQERFPCLRSLTVALAVAPQDIRIYARLRKLSLSHCRCGFSFDYFLDALAASANLQSLELDSILHRIQGDWVTSVATSRKPLSLARLKSLKLIADPPPVYISRFLSHVLLSATVSVCIKGDLGVGGILTETVAATLPSNPATVLPGLALAKEVFVHVSPSDYSLSCSDQRGVQEPDPITLQIDSSSIRDWSGFSRYAALDLQKIFASAPLARLDFFGDCGYVPPELWREIFDRYPLLDTLALDHCGTTETAFAGLMAAAPAPGSLVPCPKLEFVSVGGLGPFYGDETIDVMLQCLRDRAAKGHRLGRIDLELWHTKDNTLLDTVYIPQLRELVSEVYVGQCGEWILLHTFSGD